MMHLFLISFPLFNSRDIDGRMLLDIFDEKLHPLSVRPQPKMNFHYTQTIELSGLTGADKRRISTHGSHSGEMCNLRSHLDHSDVF